MRTHITLLLLAIASPACRHGTPAEPVTPGTPIVGAQLGPDANLVAPSSSPAPVLTPPIADPMPSTSPTPPIAPGGATDGVPSGE